ncbi:cAMP phosphodiesterase [Prochlorococcus sp. MIT 1300]|uniref:cAMP phosphodiesterase n=1 Tax=Prochlorococcus sp. MIT 1300 TaxID=3096218 RepID=UPI002A75005B|nr:cAMP phosphodiesterase [Prochlorococcus sp. MIT 1300]
MRKSSTHLRNVLLAPIALALLGLGSCSKTSSKPGPATDSDIRLYRSIGTSYLCNARVAKVDFDKALGIAARTYAQLLKERHGSIVKSAGSQKLPDKRLFRGAADQVLAGSILFCPKLVPEDVKTRVNETLSQQKNNTNTK